MCTRRQNIMVSFINVTNASTKTKGQMFCENTKGSTMRAFDFPVRNVTRNLNLNKCWRGTKQFTQAKKCTLADGARSRAIPNPILTPMKGVTLGKNPFNASNAKRSSSIHGPSDAITLKSTLGQRKAFALCFSSFLYTLNKIVYAFFSTPSFIRDAIPSQLCSFF